MAHLNAFVIAAFLAATCDVARINAQSPAPIRRVFEAATIKPTEPENSHLQISLPGSQVSVEGFTLKDLIAFAYQLDRSQILGGPKWMASDRYDVLGKPDTAAKPSLGDVRLLLQTLVEDRWQLKFHRERKEMPVLVLTVAKGGPKMKARTEGDGGGATRLALKGGGPNLPARNASMKQLAELLQSFVFERPVLDKTGLTGSFDFTLTWKPEPDQFRGKGESMVSNPDDPDIFKALQEQLGLKLDSSKEQTEVIVIDSVERPSDN